jgi:hypothetical protein
MSSILKESCLNVGCNWIEDNSINSGICISSSSEITKNMKCELLMKDACNKYIKLNNSYIKSEIIDDAPCFFNGIDDDSDLHCVEKALIESKGCESIKTNSIIIFEGQERESCNNAHIIFGWPFICGWVKKYTEASGYCGYIYFLAQNGFLFILFFIF